MQIAFSDICLLSFPFGLPRQHSRWSLSGSGLSVGATTNGQEVQEWRDMALQRGKNVEKVDGSMHGV